MSNDETSEQERTDLEVTVCSNGVVNVHRPESERAHSVFVDGGDVVRCSCKGHKFRDECTHADEIERRPLILASASAAASSPTPQVATDGGKVVDDTDDDSSDGREQPTRSEPADFGGGEASGMDDLGDPAETVDDGGEADPCAECGEDMTGRFLAPADPDGDVCVSCAADLDDEDADTEADDEPGTIDVHGCSTCSGFAQGDNDQCAECRQRGVDPIDDTPL